MITKLEVLLSEKNNQLSATSEPQAKTSSEASQKDCSPVPASPTTSTCSEQDSPMEHQNKTEATDNPYQCASLKETKQLKLDGHNESSGKQMWVKFGRIQLSKLDCYSKEIECGDWLTDKHINYAQALIKSQFQIQGVQSTLLQKSIHSISTILLKGNVALAARRVLALDSSLQACN